MKIVCFKISSVRKFSSFKAPAKKQNLELLTHPTVGISLLEMSQGLFLVPVGWDAEDGNDVDDDEEDLKYVDDEKAWSTIKSLGLYSNLFLYWINNLANTVLLSSLHED